MTKRPSKKFLKNVLVFLTEKLSLKFQEMRPVAFESKHCFSLPEK